MFMPEPELLSHTKDDDGDDDDDHDHDDPWLVQLSSQSSSACASMS